LDQFDTWLDQADKMVLDLSKEGLPLKDMKQKQKDLEKQVAGKQKLVNQINTTSQDVIVKCSAPLSTDIGEQIDLSKERWTNLTIKMNKLREKYPVFFSIIFLR
jgi:flagellar biosynthesis/type III secretory pathway chaperone